MRTLLISLAALLVLFALIAVSLFGSDAEGVYRSAPLERSDIVTTVTASGTVSPVVTVDVSSQQSGQLSALMVDFNDTVEQDQPLARLDPQAFEADVRAARAELDVARADVLAREAARERASVDLTNAQAGLVVVGARADSARAKMAELQSDLERKRSLGERKVISASDLQIAQSQFDSASSMFRAEDASKRVAEGEIASARASLRMADAQLQIAQAVVRQREAALDHAEVQLERTIIRAPIAGIVIRRDVDVGQTVATSLQAPTLFTIVQDLSRVKVEAKVDEADIGQVRPGQAVIFTVDAYPGREFVGEVIQVRKSPEVFQSVVTYTVVIAADNPDQLLLPGMTAIARITTQNSSDVLTVPNAALRFTPPGRTAPAVARAADGAAQPGRGAVVWVRGADGSAQPVAIRIGTSDNRRTAVLAGPLTTQDQVIVGYESRED